MTAALAAASGSRFGYLGWITGGHVAIHWYVAVFALALPFLQKELDLSPVKVGAITTVQMGVGSGLLLASGYVADSFRGHERLILVLSIIILGLGFLTVGAMESYGWTLAAAALIGLAIALWHPAAMGSLSLRFPDRRGLALSVHGVGASLGDSIGPLVIGAVILVIDWRLAFQIHLAPAFMIAGILWLGLTMAQRRPEASVPAARLRFQDYVRGVGDMFTNAQAAAVLASTALANMARLAVLTFLPIYLGVTLDFSSFKLGLYLSLLYILGAVSQPIMGLISDRAGRKAVLVPSFGLMALLYLAIAFSGGGVLLALVISALGLFFYAILNITQTAIMDVAEESVQASTMGVMGLTSQPFVLGSPVLAGYLVERFGIESAFIYAAATGALATLIMVPVRFRSMKDNGR